MKANIVKLENTGKRGRESKHCKSREYRETREGKHDCKNKRIQGNEGGKE